MTPGAAFRAVGESPGSAVALGRSTAGCDARGLLGEEERGRRGGVPSVATSSADLLVATRHPFFGSFTTVTKKSSMSRTTSMKRSKSTGLVTYALAWRS